MTVEEVGLPMLHTFDVAVHGTKAWRPADEYESGHNMAVEYPTSDYSRPISICISRHSMGMALWDNEVVSDGVDYRETSPIITTLLPRPSSSTEHNEVDVQCKTTIFWGTYCTPFNASTHSKQSEK